MTKTYTLSDLKSKDVKTNHGNFVSYTDFMELLRAYETLRLAVNLNGDANLRSKLNSVPNVEHFTK